MKKKDFYSDRAEDTNLFAERNIFTFVSYIVHKGKPIFFSVETYNLSSRPVAQTLVFLNWDLAIFVHTEEFLIEANIQVSLTH